MQFDSTRPIWLQVMEQIQIDIVTGKKQPGEKLPGGRDLALIYSINPNTAARVYQELEKSGLCETRRGMGTYVTEQTEQIMAAKQEMAQRTVEDFLKRMELLGYTREQALEQLMKMEEE